MTERDDTRGRTGRRESGPAVEGTARERAGAGATTRSLPARGKFRSPARAGDASPRTEAEAQATADEQRRLDRENFGWGEIDPTAEDEDDQDGDPVARALEHEEGEPLSDADSYADEVGADVGGARVVAGAGAEAAASAVDARAFTVGDRVFLGAGESATDRALMAHELTHVAQQRGAATPAAPAELTISRPTDGRELEADGTAALTSGPLEIARTPRGVRTKATRDLAQRVEALAETSNEDLGARKADLTARLSGKLSGKARNELAQERDAIEWVQYQRRLEQGEPGQAGTYTEELDGAQAAGQRHGIAATEIGARARIESAYRTGGEAEAFATKLRLGMGGTAEQKGAIHGQGSAIEAETAAFKQAFREQARHTAIGMLDQSTGEIHAALTQHGFVGDNSRLFEAAKAYNRDPSSIDQLVADWRGLSDVEERADATRKGDKEQAKLASRVGELRRLQAQADRLAREERDFTEADWAQRDAIDGADSSYAVKARLAEAWLEAETEFPILLAFRHQKYGPDTDRLGGLTSQGAGMEQAMLRQAIPKLGNILRTKVAVRTEQLDPMRMAPVVELTKQQMKVPPGSARAAVAQDMYEAANEESLADWALSALSIALSVLSFVPGVGLGAKALAEATSLAIELRAQVNEYKEWKVAGGMNNTALDMARSVSTHAPELRPLYLRLAVAGASAASLLQLTRLVAKLQTVRATDGVADDVLREIDDVGARHGVKNLGDEVEAAGAVRGAKTYPAKTFDKGDGITGVTKINTQRVQEGLKKTKGRDFVGGARLETDIAKATSEGATGVLRIPAKGDDTLVTVELRFQGELTTAAAHGAEAGPARFTLDRSGKGPWVAKIEVSSAVEPRDVEFVVGHELDEIAELVRRYPEGKPLGGFADEMEAGVMREGAKSGQSTAHDVATAREVVALYKDHKRLASMDAASTDARKKSLDEAIKAAGLGEVSEIDAKVNLLRRADAPESLLDEVRLVASNQLASVHSRAMGTTGTKFTEGMIDHIMWGRDKGEFAKKGISGGHVTERLRQMGYPNSEYVFIQTAEKAAGGSTARQFSQYKWKGTLETMPHPGSGRFPTDKPFNDTGWVTTDLPKTTFDDPEAFLREAEEAWDDWVEGVALAPSGQRKLKQAEFTARTKSGIQISGYFDVVDGQHVPTSAYPEASWF